jgi:hypothetical protein
MTPAFQSRWPFRKALGRHRTRFQTVHAGPGRTIPALIGIRGRNDFQNRGRVAKVGLDGVATWEREIMLERQREGIARAKGEGKYKGRPASIDAAEISD